MQCMGSIVVLCLMFGLVSCELHHRNTSLLDTAKALAESTKIAISNSLSSVSVSNETVLDIFHKLSHGPESSENSSVSQNETNGEMEDDYSWLGEDSLDENVTEFLGIDSDGCDRGLRKHLEERCDDEYDRVNGEAQNIEDHSQKTEALCCALEDFEKCNLLAFDKANCGGDKAAIKENMKAARLFITVVANVTCSRFRGQCAYYATASSPIPLPLPLVLFASIFVTLKLVTAL